MQKEERLAFPDDVVIKLFTLIIEEAHRQILLVYFQYKTKAITHVMIHVIK